MKATWCGDSAQTMQALVVTSCGTRDQSRVAGVWRHEPTLHISLAKRAGAGALRDVTCLEATIGFSSDIKSPDFCYVPVLPHISVPGCRLSVLRSASISA
jgi:hypothetical protein